MKTGDYVYVIPHGCNGKIMGKQGRRFVVDCGDQTGVGAEAWLGGDPVVLVDYDELRPRVHKKTQKKHRCPYCHAEEVIRNEDNNAYCTECGEEMDWEEVLYPEE